jgi:hypothetical protein
MKAINLVSPRDQVEIHLPDGRVLSGPRGSTVGEFLSALEYDSSRSPFPLRMARAFIAALSPFCLKWLSSICFRAPLFTLIILSLQVGITVR